MSRWVREDKSEGKAILPTKATQRSTRSAYARFWRANGTRPWAALSSVRARLGEIKMTLNTKIGPNSATKP